MAKKKADGKDGDSAELLASAKPGKKKQAAKKGLKKPAPKKKSASKIFWKPLLKKFRLRKQKPMVHLKLLFLTVGLILTRAL